MELVRFSKTINLPIDHNKIMPLQKDHGYVMANTLAAQIKAIYGSDVIAIKHDFVSIYGNKEYKGESLEGKTITMWRTGGAGDLLFLSPSLKKIKEIYPNSTIHLGTSAKYLDLFRYFPYANSKIPLPLPEELIKASDYYCIFEGIIESNKEAEKTNAYDLFSKRLNVFHLLKNEEKIPLMFLGESENEWAKAELKQYESSKGFVGIQLSASAILRTYPKIQLGQVCKELAEDGYKVFFIGSQREAPHIDLLIDTLDNHPNLVNFAKLKTDWQRSAALIKNLNLMITPDSSLAHIAAAVETPILGIYGPFKSEVRFKYYKNAVAIDANSICPACFAHGQLPCRWSKDVTAESYSKCFDCISPELIGKVARQILEKTKK